VIRPTFCACLYAATAAILGAQDAHSAGRCGNARPFRAPLAVNSPRVSALRKQIDEGNRSAVESFWAVLAQTGTPLIEPPPGDACYSLVTFVWKGEPGTRNVAIVGGINGEEPAKNQMIHLADTDVWYLTYEIRNDARFSYGLSPNDSLKSLVDPNRDSLVFKRDPLNARQLSEAFSSYVELPAAPAELNMPVAETNRGALIQTTFTSTLLKNTRDVWIYTPAGFNPGRDRYPLLVLFDGFAYTGPAQVILDNLIAEGRVPPLLAILVSNKNRNVELGCSASYAEFLATELVPWAREKYHATTDAAQTIVAGSSLGGLGASFAGFTHPEVFGNVLSMSGSYWWNPQDDLEPEWLTRQFARSPKRPVRLFVAIGLMEMKDRQLATNRHFRDILIAKGYSVEYREFNGAHSYLNWRGSLADGLLYLFGEKSF
jgi:enterochelin esterase-like enzyme